MTDKSIPGELEDDIEVIGPGTMLREGREKMGLTVDEVAERLNMRRTLVAEIESEKFSDKVPTTFTRGYLKNYAKLVQVPVEQVLASFEMLAVAKTQGAEMQSFSRQTEKQAENSRIMMISYLVIAILIGLTIWWWYQNKISSESQSQNAAVLDILPSTQKPLENAQDIETNQQQLAQQALDELVESVNETDSALTEQSQLRQDEPEVLTTLESESENVVVATAQLVFTFAGDCWVNISDATGERIAWGIKKADYVMTISGIPPFSVTLGKPEQVSIQYNNNAVDMSGFAAGHIAKFELPLNE